MIVPSRELMPVIRVAMDRGQLVRLTVTGGSMWPFLRDGDVVELAPLSSPVHVGDLLLARRDGGDYVLHRAARMYGDSIYLIGDAQRELEGPFAYKQIVGRVTAAWHGAHLLPIHHFLWRVAVRIGLGLTPLRPGLWRTGILLGQAHKIWRKSVSTTEHKTNLDP